MSHGPIMGDEENYATGQLAMDISQAIAERRKNPQQYRNVIEQIGSLVANSDQAENQNPLALYYQALASVVASLNKQTTDLVEQTLKLNIAAVREDVLQYAMEYFEALVSSCALFGQSIFKTLIHQTTYTTCSDAVSEPALATIVNIVQHVPSQQRIMEDVFAQECPWYRKDHQVLSNFFRNLFDMALALPVMLPLALNLVVGTCLQLDLATRDDIEEEEEEDAADDQDMFDLDMEPDEGRTSQAPTPAAEDPDAPRSKLNALMQLTFDFIGAWQAQEPQALHVLWGAIKTVFMEQILPTHQSKRVQFLLFYVSALQPEFVEDWLNTMVELTLDVSQHMPVRQAACAYMASYLARAKFMSHTTVANYMGGMAKFAHEYAQAHAGSLPNVTAHLMFYAYCQALFYITCFRAKTFYQNREGCVFLQSLPFESLASSSLQPLKNCSSTVVGQFDKVMEALELLIVKPFVQNGSRRSSLLPQAQRDGTVMDEVLEDFFPFDPLDLAVKEHVQQLYLSWEECDVTADSRIPPPLSVHLEQDEDDFLAGSMQSRSLSHDATPRSFAGSLLSPPVSANAHASPR
eukprot:TRINITY_DN11907_c0_g1_i6.p1 TRINITY_DN11907_c0_g1~~TRINITY_DN11907_c0_g1_i6.p1  ORF type:complete len:577 (+),score=157.21 TRINITY_DN11907_c0_g1_i6:123-1853(+)